MKKDFSDKVIEFYRTLDLTDSLPHGAEVMNPYKTKEVQQIIELFYKKYYADTNDRIFILGINPGRFGSGVTGITFTDPIRLEKECGIINSFYKRPELSSVFIYEMINLLGGPENFFSSYFLSAVSPLGFLKDGRNMNFYDDKKLQSTVRTFIVRTLKQQVDFGADREKCICLGEGKNYHFLDDINREYNFFKRIIPLAHPRFIMQYNLKKKEEYLKQYIAKLVTVD